MADGVSIPKHSRTREAWHEFFNQLQSLGALHCSDERQPCCVATWPWQAVYEAGTNRIANCRHHYRNSLGRISRRCNWFCSICHNDIDIGLNELSCKRGQAFQSPVGVAKLKNDISPFDPTELLQPLSESFEAGPPLRVISGKSLQHSDASYSL